MQVEFLKDTNGRFGQVYKAGTVCSVDADLLKQLPKDHYKKTAAKKKDK